MQRSEKVENLAQRIDGVDSTYVSWSLMMLLENLEAQYLQAHSPKEFSWHVYTLSEGQLYITAEANPQPATQQDDVHRIAPEVFPFFVKKAYFTYLKQDEEVMAYVDFETSSDETDWSLTTKNKKVVAAEGLCLNVVYLASGEEQVAKLPITANIAQNKGILLATEEKLPEIEYAQQEMAFLVKLQSERVKQLRVEWQSLGMHSDDLVAWKKKQHIFWEFMTGSEMLALIRRDAVRMIELNQFLLEKNPKAVNVDLLQQLNAQLINFKEQPIY